MRIALTLAIAVLLPLTAGAEVYRWVDEKGQVHYSQTPPKQQGYGTVAPPPPASASPNQDELKQSLEQGRKEEAQRQQENRKSEQELAQRQERCNRARERLAYLDTRTAHRLAKTDEQGNVARWTEAEYQQERAAQEQTIRENCG